GLGQSNAPALGGRDRAVPRLPFADHLVGLDLEPTAGQDDPGEQRQSGDEQEKETAAQQTVTPAASHRGSPHGRQSGASGHEEWPSPARVEEAGLPNYLLYSF